MNAELWTATARERPRNANNPRRVAYKHGRSRGRELELGGLVDDVDQRADADRQRPLVEVEGRLVQVELRAAAAPHAEPGHRAGHLFEIPREVLAAAGLTGVA